MHRVPPQEGNANVNGSFSQVKMDSSNSGADEGHVRNPLQVVGGEAVENPGAEGGDQRTPPQPDSRPMIINKIMETLKRHLPCSGPEGLQKLEKLAVQFEEKIYTTATSQQDYLRKISLKMLTKYQNPVANSLHNAASNSETPQDSASLDSSGQTGNASLGDWQEETYQKIKSMNEMYFPDINEMYQRMAAKLQQHDRTVFQHDAFPGKLKDEQVEKLRFLKVMLERFIIFLRTNKSEVQIHHKDKIVGVEKQIVNILSSNRHCKPVSSLREGQMAQTPMDAMQQSIISQMHANEGLINFQMQPMITQGSESAMNSQQNKLTSQASLDSSGKTSLGDWQEEIYQKIKSMHEMYFPDLNEIYQRMAAKLQEHDAFPGKQKDEQLEKLRFLKVMLERFIIFLRTNKNEVQIHHKDKIVGVEKQIVDILNSNRPCKPVSSLRQGQMAKTLMDAMPKSQTSQMHAEEVPMNSPGDSEKVNSGISSLLNAANSAHHPTTAASIQNQSLAISSHGVEQPLELLSKVIKTMSPKASSPPVSDISSVDRIAGSAPGNGSCAAVGEDVVAMPKCRLQARISFTQDGPSGTKKMRQCTSAVPSNVVSTTGSVNDCHRHLNVNEDAREFTGASSVKRPRIEANHAVKEELQEINQSLLDTVLYISEDDADSWSLLQLLLLVNQAEKGTIVK